MDIWMFITMDPLIPLIGLLLDVSGVILLALNLFPSDSVMKVKARIEVGYSSITESNSIMVHDAKITKTVSWIGISCILLGFIAQSFQYMSDLPGISWAILVTCAIVVVVFVGIIFAIRAIKSVERHALARLKMSDGYQKMSNQKYDDAIDLFQKALIYLSPKNRYHIDTIIELYFTLANIYMNIGDNSQARNAIKHAERIDSTKVRELITSPYESLTSLLDD